jgi:hypothetical protein
MGSSCVRRKLREFRLTGRFVESGFKGALHTQWRGTRPLGHGRSMKVGNRAEKSSRSKRRRRRGLRSGKGRVRGDKPRPPPKRQTSSTDNTSSRTFRKFETQFDHWEKRIGEFKRRFAPTMERWIRDRGSRASADFVFDMEDYRKWRNRFNTLQTHIRRSNIASRFLAVTWGFFLDKEFRWTFPGRPSIADDLYQMFLGTLSPGIPVRPANTTAAHRSGSSPPVKGGVGSLSRTKCPHGRSLLTCPVCAKGVKPSDNSPKCDCPIPNPTSRGLCVNCSRRVATRF